MACGTKFRIWKSKHHRDAAGDEERTARQLVGFIAMVVFGCFLIIPSASAQASQVGVNGGNLSQLILDAKNSVDRATGLALQGDAAEAVKVLAKISETGFRGEDASFRTCMVNRFGSDPADPIDQNFGDPWVTSLATDYLTYWKQSLTHPDERSQAEQALRSRLSRLLGHSLTNDADFDAAEDQIKAEALKRGFYVLLGRTQPLRELMIWKKLTVEQRQVNLPEGPQSVRVTYLDDFLLRGWGYYATCKRRSAGGWATDDGLFAVVPAYKSLTDETFSVRFLAHESQHFADKKTFPNLESWELEYRAKLVELSLAESSQDSTLQLICENRTESKTSPHGYADFRVVDDVTRHLRITPNELCKNKIVIGQPLRDAAKAVLLEDSKKRTSKD
ncbi:MAG TPA: hypothetical protein VFA71_07930 [Terriglobales bacterium]|nr:hypothetical protein [Terriglobales bacterium]